MTLGFLIIGAVVVLGVLAFAVRLAARKRRLAPTEAGRLQAAFERAASHADPHRRILDAEKALDQAFAALGYAGSFGEKLKKAGPRLRDVDAVWRAHKLRNRIAHEMDIAVDEREARAAIEAFRKALKGLC